MRDNRLDVIRGLAILLLTMTHTVPGPALMAAYGHYYPKFGLFFHGADIFVAYSGLVCGMVYLRTIRRDGATEGIRKGLIRAAQLFVYNAAACILVLMLLWGFGAAGIRPELHVLDRPLIEAAIGTILLFDPIEYFNILNYYIVMLAVLPFFVMAQMRARWPIVLSAAIYVLYTARQLATGQVGKSAPSSFPRWRGSSCSSAA